MFREIDIVVNLHDLLVWTGVGLAALIFVALLIARRRWFPLWRRAWSNSWYRREYIGETTWFPTYRKRLGDVWVTPMEEGRNCYRSSNSSTKEAGRRSRMDEAEAKIRERQQRGEEELEREAAQVRPISVDSQTVREVRPLC